MDTNTAGVLAIVMLLLFYYGVYRLAAGDNGVDRDEHRTSYPDTWTSITYGPEDQDAEDCEACQ